MNILALETSCDETAAAVVQDGRTILSNVVVSQIDIFKAYGGVIPEIAARSHLEAILPVIHQALDQAFPAQTEDQQWAQIDAIAVTHTPGLLGSLLIGTLTARTLAILHDKPFYPTHHLKSHIYACWLQGQSQENLPTFPLLALVVSGGHTQTIYMSSHNQFEIIGTTRDDAVGECFDKVAKILGLPYPGGPNITAAANGHITKADGTTIETAPGNPHKYHFPHPRLTNPARVQPQSSPASSNTSTPASATSPRTSPATSPAPQPASADSSLDFSFSGLKTAVLRAVQHAVNRPISFPSHQLAPLLTPEQIADFAASFQQTAVDILLEKLALARQLHPDARDVVIAGGVSANSCLRETANSYLRKAGSHLREAAAPCFFPEPKFSGDNAAMVGAAAYYDIQSGTQPADPYHLDILPRSAIH